MAGYQTGTIGGPGAQGRGHQPGHPAPSTIRSPRVTISALTDFSVYRRGVVGTNGQFLVVADVVVWQTRLLRHDGKAICRRDGLAHGGLLFGGQVRTVQR